ncbi:hypothetical protein HYU13_00940 [Candidatus Woesearchaeota archaeon]|nr:hypothetical protein [Candidatus Woesearchaeota archaeon]
MPQPSEFNLGMYAPRNFEGTKIKQGIEASVTNVLGFHGPEPERRSFQNLRRFSLFPRSDDTYSQLIEHLARMEGIDSPEELFVAMEKAGFRHLNTYDPFGVDATYHDSLMAEINNGGPLAIISVPSKEGGFPFGGGMINHLFSLERKRAKKSASQPETGQ